MEDGTRMWGRPRWMCAVALFALGGIGAWRVAGGAEAKPPEPELGANASLHGKGVFPADDPWNQDVSAAAVDPNSDKIIASIGEGKSLHPDWASGENSGIPYVVVDGRRQAKVAIKFTDYGYESDPGPYPVPADAPVEGGAKSDGD